MFKFIMPKLFLNIERWKWNADYRIYVSNMGHFKNEYRQDIPIQISRDGYCTIKTPYIGYRSVHRLIMLTWKPIPDAENLTVDHLDHNKRNNALSNLEWVTEEENQTRAKKDFLNQNLFKENNTTLKKKNKQLSKKENQNKDIQNLLKTIRNMEQASSNSWFNMNPITDGKTVYSTVGEAVAYILGPNIHANGDPNKKTIKRVHNRILLAIENGSVYHEKEWRFVENE